ncbi:MAG: hypothetical protein ACLS90_07385 [Clostridia bacterium]
MYGTEYENYIRSILGYPSINTDVYQHSNRNDYNTSNKRNLEEFYPEIYKIVYPMIQTAINKHTTANTKEDIDNIAEEIYIAFEDQSHINDKKETNLKQVAMQKESKMKTVENRGGMNNNMRDLIKILLIRELLKTPPPPPPPRPPYDRPPMKPPIMHRGYQYQPLYDIYEY